MFSANEAVYSLVYYDLFDFEWIILGLLVFGICYYAANKKIVARYATLNQENNLMSRVKSNICKRSVKLFTATILLFYVYSKTQNLIEINQPLSNLKGVQQRIAVLEKLDAYQDHIPFYNDHFGYHRGGFLNVIGFWDEKPTKTEMIYLKEYLSKIFDTYEELLNKNKVCSSKRYPETASIYVRRKEVLRLSQNLKKFSYNLNSDNKADLELINNTDLLIKRALENYFECREHNNFKS